MVVAGGGGTGDIVRNRDRADGKVVGWHEGGVAEQIGLLKVERKN